MGKTVEPLHFTMKISVYLLAVLSATMATPTLENLQSQLPQLIQTLSQLQSSLPPEVLSQLQQSLPPFLSSLLGQTPPAGRTLQEVASQLQTSLPPFLANLLASQLSSWWKSGRQWHTIIGDRRRKGKRRKEWRKGSQGK